MLQRDVRDERISLIGVVSDVGLITLEEIRTGSD